MEEFIENLGLAYSAHVLGRVYDRFLKGFGDWYPEVGLEAPARTHSTMHALHEHGSLGVTEVAVLIRQSHQLVIKWVDQLTQLGLVESSSDPSDGRRTVLRLTQAGIEEFKAQQLARKTVARAIERLMKETGSEDFFAALWRIEKALQKDPFTDRLRREAGSGSRRK